MQDAPLAPAPYIVGHLGAEVFVEPEPDPVQLSWRHGARQVLHRAADLGQPVTERALDVGLDAGRGGRLVLVQREILPVLALGDGDLPAEEGNCLRLGVVRPVDVLPTCFVFRDAEAARWPQLRATAPSSALRVMLGNAIYRA